VISHCHTLELRTPHGQILETSYDFEYLKGIRDMYNATQPGHTIIWVR
jgi:hypothetical protein